MGMAVFMTKLAVSLKYVFCIWLVLNTNCFALKSCSCHTTVSWYWRYICVSFSSIKRVVLFLFWWNNLWKSCISSLKIKSLKLIHRCILLEYQISSFVHLYKHCMLLTESIWSTVIRSKGLAVCFLEQMRGKKKDFCLVGVISRKKKHHREI